MDKAPEAKMELASVSETEDCLFKSSLARLLVIISHPRVENSEMLLTLNIKDWDEYYSFFYPLKDIDNYQLMVHIMFKLSADPNRELLATAEMNINEKNPLKLNLSKWKFI